MSTRCHIENAYRQTLTELGVSDYDSMMRCQGGVPVEVHRTHTIHRFQASFAGRPIEILLKRELIASDRLTTRQLLRGRRPRSASVLEAELASQLDQAGVSTLRPVAWGERSTLGRPREAFVMLVAPPGLFPLEQILERRPGVTPLIRQRQRRMLLRRIGAMFRCLKSIKDHDLAFTVDRLSVHLPSPTAPLSSDEVQPLPMQNLSRDEVALIYIPDLRSVIKKKAAVDRSEADTPDGFQFLASLPPGWLSTTDLLALAAGYSGVKHQPRAERREIMARDWPIRSVREIRRLVALQIERSLHAPFRPGRLRQAGNLRVDDRYAEILRNTGLRTAKDVFRWRPPEHTPGDEGLLQEEKSSRKVADRNDVLLKTVDVDGTSLRFRLYRFLKPPIKQQIRRMTTGRVLESSSQCLLNVSEWLAERDVPCPAPVVIAQKMLGPCELGSFILFREFEGTLMRDLRPEFVAELPFKWRRQLIRDAADLCRRFELTGLSTQADPATYLTLAARDQWSTYPWWIVGLHTFRRPRGRSGPTAQQALLRLRSTAQRLKLTRTDLWRFLLSYAGRWEDKPAKSQKARRLLQQLCKQQPTAHGR